MTHWIVGDIHGCAQELAELIERLALGPGDQLIAAGDLYHRGPDPLGVARLLEACGASFILGNHEHVMLKRCGLTGTRADGADRPPLRLLFPPLTGGDLSGDGGTPLCMDPADAPELLRFTQGHSGYRLRGSELEGAGLTPDGRDWCVVHAGLAPGKSLERNPLRALVSIRKLEARGRPWWYERYTGRELVLFGHTHSAVPRAYRVGGELRALGLDTGCVFGGKLTAYSPELDEFAVVTAKRDWMAA
jgi:bis(5'-nucleosyl)-tetraphosphatase (symmetrical)